MQTYNSSDSDSEINNVNSSSNLKEKEVRSVYLVTYSQANKEEFPRREVFARVLVESFEFIGANVFQWCCSEESHENGGKHYHMAIKLSKIYRWNAAKRYLREHYGITVNFSSNHHNYYSAWAYVTKHDKEYIESTGHPDLANTGEPITAKASKSVQKKGKKRGRPSKAAKVTKRARLSAYEVSDILISKEIKNITQLQALAYAQKKEGKQDLMQFLLGRTRKAVCELIDSTWEIKYAGQRIERASKTRHEILVEARRGACFPGCRGEWLSAAQEILVNNGIERHTFAQSIQEALVQGRGKYRNIMITGPANCGKTFILKPLTVIFDCFCNPATGSFAWIGVENKECIFLNDFRWSAQMIPWHDLLLMLEGEIVHLPAPKTHYSKDLQLSKDTPIFCTTKRPLVFVKNGVIDDRESEMMAVRWKIFNFSSQIPEHKQRSMTPCGRCFAAFILDR